MIHVKLRDFQPGDFMVRTTFADAYLKKLELLVLDEIKKHLGPSTCLVNIDIRLTIDEIRTEEQLRQQADATVFQYTANWEVKDVELNLFKVNVTKTEKKVVDVSDL